MRHPRFILIICIISALHFSYAQHWRKGYWGKGKKIPSSFGMLADYGVHSLNNRGGMHEYNAGNHLMFGINATHHLGEYAGFSVGCALHELNFSETYKGYFGGNTYNELNVQYKLRALAVPLSLLFSRRSENFMLRFSYTPILFSNLQSATSYTGNISDINQQNYQNTVFDFKQVRQQFSVGMITRLDFDNSVLNIEPNVGLLLNPEINSFNKKGYAPLTFGIRLSYEYVEVFNGIYNRWVERYNARQNEKKKKLEEKKRKLEEKLKNELNRKSQNN